MPPPVDGKTSATGIVVESEPKGLLRRVMGSFRKQQQSSDSSTNLQSFHGIQFSVPYLIKVITPVESRDKVQHIIETIFAEVDKIFSYNAQSELMKLNRLPANQTVTISEPMRDVLSCVADVAKSSGGLFDPTVFPLAKYTYEQLKQTGRLPDNSARNAQFQALKAVVGWSNILIEGNQLTKKVDGVELDLGGVAKGWTIDRLMKALTDGGFTDVYVDWGGDIKASGMNPNRVPWQAGIVLPPALGEDGRPGAVVPDDFIKSVTLVHSAIATSGDYMQNYENGYFHIFNPVTSQPLKASSTAIASASVLTPMCMLADALATAAMLIGDVTKAREMLEKYKRKNPLVEYWLYVREGDRLVEGRRKRARGFQNVADDEDRKKIFSDADSAHVVVVGGGLAGLSACVEAYNCGAKVTLLEKEDQLGGNSAKATSGINGWATQAQIEARIEDTEELFERDTYLSGKGGVCDFGCVRMLSTRSADAVAWLRDEFGIPLTVLSQLGGHTRSRTHRAPDRPDGTPTPIGWDIMRTLNTFVSSLPGDRVKVILKAKMKRLIREDDHDLMTARGKVRSIRVVGVEYEDAEGNSSEVQCDAIVLATGGYCADVTHNSLLKEFTPDLLSISTTNGAFATGDGIKIGREIGAALVDMDKVQLHPTSFIDPKDPTNRTKYLGPEALRGSGGILLKQDGTRFANELDLRSKVTQAILSKCSPMELEGGKQGFPFAYCILNSAAISKFGPAALNFYKNSLGLFEDAPNLKKLAELMNVPEDSVKKTLEDYNAAAAKGICPSTGKSVFPVTYKLDDSFVVSKITPSLHYCMGGLRISPAAEVQMMLPAGHSIFGKRCPIFGLFAAGECTGGVHGANRLGGNSLLECVVFGRIAGERAAAVRQKTEEALSKTRWTPLALREVRDTGDKFGISTKVFRFDLPGSMQMSGLKVGQYVAIRTMVDGKPMGGYYSPVTRPNDYGVIGILARTDIGSMKEVLSSLRPGDMIEFKAMEGLDLDLKRDGMYYHGRKILKFGLLAGGTGVAPMMQIIRAVLHGEYQDIKLSLIYAAEYVHEFSLIDAFDALQTMFPQNFKYYLTLNHPPQGWTQGVGFIDQGMMKQNIAPPADDVLAVICGPPRMCAAMKASLTKLGYPDNTVFSY